MRIAANISTLFKERPLLERFMAARRAGFDGIEVQFPYSERPEALRRAAEDAALPVVLMNTPIVPGTYPAGFAARPERREAFRAQLPMVREYADALGVGCVHVLAGCGGQESEREGCENTYVENLRLAAAALAGRAQVLIEALNPFDVPGYLVDTLSSAEAIIARSEGSALLQFDVYHIARMGKSPSAELERVWPIVRHVQFADAPGRHEPGSGQIDFNAIVGVLRRRHYPGWLGAEYIPSTTTESGLSWLADWQRALR
jgi:hydroxypyruvate isomerase